MMNLFQAHACVRQYSLHRLCVCDGRSRLSVQRLDENAHATIYEPRAHEPAGVVDVEKARLDPDPARNQQLAQLDDAGLSLVSGDKVGQLGPSGGRLLPPRWGSIVSDVLKEIGIPGHAARTARSVAAHRPAANVSAPLWSYG